MPRADFLFSLLLLALGLATVVESWRMPRFGHLGVHPMTAPGLTPGLLGAVIVLLAAVLLARSLAAGGWRLSAGKDAAAPAEPGERGSSVRRVGLALLLTVGYAGGLVGRLPFWLATALFVFLFILAFEWRAGSGRAQRLRGLAVAAVLAALTALAVTYLFEEIFLVRLP
ncbi:MAG: tripartite tricarboxylate transporter TctB family protein [Tistlia sp.]|uniref:tripartite tricarboxylate transporter TctB family protein n=1 Tax=Tistlia sp. TaxID=3057121 RepID=UPI0034A5A1A0